MNHEINLTGYTASCNAADNMLCLGTAGSYGLEKLHVTADAAWDGLTITATFTNSGSTTVAVTDGAVDVPPEATRMPTRDRVRYGQIAFKGADADGSIRLISTPIYYKVQASSATDGENTIAPTPDQYAQFVAEVTAEADRAEAAADRAESAGSTVTQEQITQAVNDYLDENPVQATPIDSTLTRRGQAADAAVVGGRLSALSEEIENLQTSGLTTEQVNALDGMFKVCAFIKDDVSAEYNAFKTAFGITDSGGGDDSGDGGETDVTLTSISATYSGGDVAVGTAVTDLTGIVVTAHYSDGSNATVTGYTLSGEIVEGDNTISVTYNGKTATFTVIGTVTNYRVEHIVSGQTFPVTLTWSQVSFDVTPALATYVNGESTTTYYDVELDVESISSENAYITVSAGGGAFVRNASDYAGQTGTLKMTGEIWHPTMSDASQIKIACNKGTETSNQTAVITGVRIYER